MTDTRYGVVWVYSDIRARMRTHRTSRRLTNRTDVTGPAATGIHPNCIRSLRDTASRLPRVDTLRRSSLPKFHDLAECGPRALAAQLRRRALRAAPPAAHCPCSADGRSPRDRLRGGWPSSHSPVRATTLGVDDGAAGGVLAKAAPSEAARSWRGKRRGACVPAGAGGTGTRATGIRLPRGRRLPVHSFHLHH